MNFLVTYVSVLINEIAPKYHLFILAVLAPTLSQDVLVPIHFQKYHLYGTYNQLQTFIMV